MNKEPKKTYVRPILVKHGVLRDISAQFLELRQLANNLAREKEFNRQHDNVCCSGQSNFAGEDVRLAEAKEQN
jgi:hypothetical protein